MVTEFLRLLGAAALIVFLAMACHAAEAAEAPPGPHGEPLGVCVWVTLDEGGKGLACAVLGWFEGSAPQLPNGDGFKAEEDAPPSIF